MVSTMAKLFEAAGYKDYKSLPVMEFVKPKNRIGIYSIENGKKILKEVTGLVYKGEAESGYKVITPTSVFMATGEHLLYDAENNTFIKCADVDKKVIGLNDKNEKVSIYVEKCDDAFSILDLEVEGTHTYFSSGILSHNTFGGSARITAEFLKKFNILCADRDVTTLWISQERANMKPMARLPQPTGGEAIPFYSSIICRVTKSDDIKDADGIIGIEMTIRDMKNKCSVPFRLAEGVKLFFDGGFNADAEYIDFFLKLNFMVQKGAYFQFDFEGEHYSLQGRQKLMDWLYEHKDTYEKWKTDVRNMLSGHVEALDKDNYAVNEETGEALNEADQKKAEAYALKTTGGKVEDETEATADEALKD